MANWDVDRKKGGTFSFKLDAQGNYTLQKDGFGSVKTLNLPELKKEATKTTTTKDTKTASAQTQKAFGDVQPFYYKGGGGDGKDASEYTTEYSMTKDKSLDTDTKPMTTGPWDKGQWGPKPGDTTPMATKKADTTPPWAQGADKRGYENIGKVDTVPADKKQIGRVNVDQVLAARADNEGLKYDIGTPPEVGKYSGMVGPQKPSPYQDAIMRGERGVKYEKPGLPQKTTELTKTALKKVTTGLKPLAKAIGFVMNPIGSVVGMAAGVLKEDAVNKHDKSYFNVREDGRISGNAATDLYAGLNRVSAFGNLEKAGSKRIATREKTIAKYEGKWDKAKMDKFKATTDKMKDDQKGYRSSKNKATVKAAVKKGASIHNPNEMRSAGNGGGGNGNTRVICTELHSTGEMSTVDWIRDTRFTFKTLTQKHVKGYLFWAVPTVKLMKKYPLYRKIWKHLAQHRANDIAWRLDEGKFDLLGRIYAGIGEPLCWLIGNCVSDKHIKEFNIKNWRKA